MLQTGFLKVQYLPAVLMFIFNSDEHLIYGLMLLHKRIGLFGYTKTTVFH